MRKRTKIAVATVAGLAIVTGGAGAALAASGGDDNEKPITGDALDRASAAALEHTGEGRVTETEVSDEDSLYEVEVTLDDGGQVDVQLDDHFRVVSDERDAPHDDRDASD